MELIVYLQQKQQLKSGEDLLNKVETLLNDMNNFLSKYNIELSISKNR